MNRIVGAIFAALLLIGGVTACGSDTPPPAPEQTQPDVEPATTPEAEQEGEEVELTPKQKHIAEDALEALKQEPYSKNGLIDFLTHEYAEEDVLKAVGSISCEVDWMAQAEHKAATYNLTDDAEIKARLLADGFTEEQAEFGVNPVPQS